MYSHRYIRENFELLRDKLKLRGVSEDLLNKTRELSEELSSVTSQIVALNAERNTLVKEDAIGNREKIKSIKHSISELTKKEQDLESHLSDLLFSIPNVPHDSLTGQSELLKTWGTKKEASYKLLSHQELATRNGLFSLEMGATISGSGFVVYTGIGAKLYRSLIQFTLDNNKSRGYEERWLPVIVSSDSLFGTAQLPKFEGDLFKVDDGKYLSPTSETQLTNLYRNKIIESKDLPIKVTANTNCFRKEAGAHGMETTGIIRLHQFCKTELVIICKEEDSFDCQEQMLKDACSILEALNLPYQVLQLAYDDMSFSATKTYDIEVWFPSENRYREISSVSNTLDFQARRAMIRYKDQLLNKSEKAKYAHVLNGSSLAIDRLFAAILDNYQNEDGSITVPEALVPYMGVSKLDV